MDAIWKMLLAALVLSLTIFMELLACFAFGDHWILLLILIPLALTPLPLMLMRCCGGSDDAFSTPRGKHWATFWTAFFFSGTVGVPVLLTNTQLISAPSLALALGGLFLSVGSCGGAAFAQAKAEDDAFTGF